MTTERRAEIVAILEHSGLAFEEAARGVPEEHAMRSPNPESWCALQIAEHVAVTEHGMFRMVGMAGNSEASVENPKREASLAKMMLNRERAATAPERVLPTGRFTSVGEALQRFSDARAGTVQFARETELDLFGLTVPHPFLGPVNGYEFLVTMAGHSLRHVAQLQELQRHDLTTRHSAPGTALPG
jgi:hypothetical protein